MKADISQAAMLSSFRCLASPIWLYTLFKPLPSSFHSLLDGLYWYIMPCTIRPHL